MEGRLRGVRVVILKVSGTIILVPHRLVTLHIKEFLRPMRINFSFGV